MICAYSYVGSNNTVPDDDLQGRLRTNCPVGVGPLQTSHGSVRSPHLFAKRGELPLAGCRLFYSAGDPTQRDPFDVCTDDKTV